MIRIVSIFLCCLQILLLDACLIKGHVIKNPCEVQELNRDLKTYSKVELQTLAKNLEANTYESDRNSGCRAALLANIYVALERMSEASGYFSLAAKKLPQLKEHFLLAKAQAEQARNRHVQAQKIALALLGSPAALTNAQFAQRVRAVLADIAVKTKDQRQIIDTHQNLLAKGYREDEALLFNLATALEQVGDQVKANQIYRRLIVNYPRSRGAVHAEKIHDLAHYQLTLKEIDQRFDRLIELLAFDQILSDTKALLNEKHFNHEERRHIEALAVKSLIMNNQFDQGIARAHKNATASNVTVEDLETYAWALSKTGRFFEAADYYGKMMAKATLTEDKARGCFFKGFSLYDASLYSMAQFAWRTCESVAKKTKHHENILWYQALAFVLDGAPQRALVPLKELKTQFPKSDDQEKYTFFLGYALNTLNKQAESKQLMLALAQKKQPTYYVLLAKAWLKSRPIKGAVIAPDALSRTAIASTNTQLQNANLLSFLGFSRDARELALNANVSTHEKVAMLQRLGFYHDAWQRSQLLNATASLDNQKVSFSPLMRASYSLPHNDVIEEVSQKYRVSANLLYAIIRTESGFAEEAMSNRGALGLMQIMPFVAKELTAHESEDFSIDLLKTPRCSIELGARLIASLMQQFGEPHLCVAAYNAGAHQVHRWLNQFGALPIELFVERIPYKQTRDYVKRVLLTESMYHAMDGKTLRLLF